MRKDLLEDTWEAAEERVEKFRHELGPFVVAAENTRMPMIFTDAVNADNPIVFANDAFLGLTGFSRLAILGKPFDFFLSDAVDAETRSSLRATMAAGNSCTLELSCRRADNSKFLASTFVAGVRDNEGVIRQNFLCFVETGGHAERFLDWKRESQALFENVPGFIATSEGPDHRFTFANASYRQFVGRERLVGFTVAEALPEIVGQGFIDLLDHVYLTGETFVGRGMPIALIDATTGATETRYGNFAYQAQHDENGVIVGLFCEGYDVTEQRESADVLAALQAELIHVTRVNAMGTLATTLAHELNQPLSAITNYAAGSLRLVEAEAPDDDSPIGQALRGIQEASSRAADIIRNLRELTRRRETTRSLFDMRAAISECIRLVSASAPPGVDIVCHVPAGTMMRADRVQIQQIIINLLRNACDAVEGSKLKEVSITARESHDEIVVSVTDTGSGVPIEAAENMFSMSNSSKAGGMGVGLSISRTIVETHGGRIWLENSSAEGSEFCFSVVRPPAEATLGTGPK